MSSGSPETTEFNSVNEWQVTIPNFNEWSFDNVVTSLTGDPNSWSFSAGTTPHISKPSSVKVPVYKKKIYIYISYKKINLRFHHYVKLLTLSKHIQSIDPQTFITLVFIHES